MTGAMELPAELEERVDEVIARYPASTRSASLPLLHLFQEQFGYISGEAVLWIADKLELEPINIFELVTFYPMLRREAPGQYHIRICRTLSCAMAGSGELFEHFCRKIGIDPDANRLHGGLLKSSDGRYSIEFVECLASCGSGPVCMVNDDFFENVDEKTADRILAQNT